MALESELKFLDADLAATSRRLRESGGESLGRYFESNAVFDYPDRSLKEKGILLRLRERQGGAVLTVKRPPRDAAPSALKVFEEIETGVDDCAAMRRSLLAVGFIEAFGYEKVREKWRFMDCVVCLDMLPFGDFVEIEGTGAAVPACAAALGLEDRQTSTATYHALNLEQRRAEGLAPDENFRFDPSARGELLRAIGKDWLATLDRR
ncbi:MAG: class IV adenylate cyclase [Desulfovibrionaceae bacterium]|nr:class IV adenylate cyclase [Desulfovibrionaceae bacterium]